MGVDRAPGFDGALAAIGASAADPLLDGAMAPASAAAFVGVGDAPVLLRGHRELEGVTPGFGPSPSDPLLLRFERAEPVRVRVVGLCEGEARELEPHRVRVARRVVPCCDAPSCTHERSDIQVWLELGDERVLVGEGRSLVGKPDDGTVAFARALGHALRVDVDCIDEPTDEAPHGDPAPPPLAASEIVRYSMRTEADRIVLRDHANAGPRTTAGRNRFLAFVLAVLAIGAWLPAVQAATSGATVRAIEVGSVAVLLSLTAYAFFGVSRFSAKYVARSTPLVAFGRGRFIVAPWVARGGALDLRPEGRLGAAIPSNEVSEVEVIKRDEHFVVTIDSDHGPIDAIAVDTEKVAKALRAAVARGIELSKHPAAQPSARMRARARAQAS